MSNKKQQGKQKRPAVSRPARPQPVSAGFPIAWLVVVLVLAGVLFWPILQHQFTNWDDEPYIVNNVLLRGPDWKGIFTQPVVSNYHPLAVLSLALNYQLSELKPFSYFFVNWALHLANAGLVFYLAWQLSGKIRWVALFTALVFAVHPMHVESVAWISERKDVLYTFFYLLALLRYWRYLTQGARADYWLTFGFFALSLLSKPAAVVLPLTLLLLDYWKGRAFDRKVWIEKAPFFVLSVAMGIVTLLIQSQKAIASLDLYSVADRLFFGCYSLVMYLVRFFVPTPLSAFHPYPPVGKLGWAIQIAPVVLLALAGALWYFRKNRVVVFGTLFYVANIILVVQFLAIGNTLLAERYTYIPYIGVAFALAMLLAQKVPETSGKALQWGLVLLVAGVFGYLSRQHIRVWENTETLWSDVIRHYPGAPVPRSNRANFYYEQAVRPENAAQYNALMEKAGVDCDAALASNPNHFASLDIRSLVHIRLGRPEEAAVLAARMTQVEKNNPKGYVLSGTALQRLKRYDEALANFSRALELNPNEADALNGRGTVLFNGKQLYREALADFDRAITIQPKGETYLNRSRCYLMLGDMVQARENAEKAQTMGTVVQQDYWDLLQ
ncbi:MAG: tetratricopeptide repeat protein [Lewinellaceae bacterium]|nr:tetratricopeptide repeat protein [Lewinellaceae bacterium]